MRDENDTFSTLRWPEARERWREPRCHFRQLYFVMHNTFLFSFAKRFRSPFTFSRLDESGAEQVVVRPAKTVKSASSDQPHRE